MDIDEIKALAFYAKDSDIWTDPLVQDLVSAIEKLLRLVELGSDVEIGGHIRGCRAEDGFACICPVNVEIQRHRDHT